MENKQIMSIVVVMFSAMGLFYGIFIMNEPLQDSDSFDSSFHITLADPTLYENGVYVESFQIEEGAYEFGFVPNGDSPQKLSIKLFAESGVVIMDNHFELEGSLVEDEISSWYTWDYLGERKIAFNESQQIKIIVSPNLSLIHI